MLDRNTTPNTLIAAMDEETAWAVLNSSEFVDLNVHHRRQVPTPNNYVYFPGSGVTSMSPMRPAGWKLKPALSARREWSKRARFPDARLEKRHGDNNYWEFSAIGVRRRLTLQRPLTIQILRQSDLGRRVVA